MGPSGRITHVIGYIGYIALFRTCICRFCIWVELSVQRRLCPIFVRNVGSPDIHECFRGLTGSQRTPGFQGVTIKTKILYVFLFIKIFGMFSINWNMMYHELIVI